jgi:uncharacterized protein YigE (DUF2233 family)
MLLNVAVYLRTRGRSLFIGFPSEAAQWQPLQDGLEYREVQHAGTTFHAVRADLRRFDLKIADARSPGRNMADAQTFLEEQHAVVAVNGTFFDDHDRPLGWLVQDGRQLNPPTHNWYSAFFVVDRPGGQVARLVPSDTPLPPPESVRFALQVGPRTVVDGAPMKLGPREAERNAICIVNPQTVILLATSGTQVEENWLAKLMARKEADGGFSCQDGMMFDGGPSTQMAIRTATRRVDVRGGWPVPNGVVLVPKAH